jgi:hypothetical protein
MIRPVSVLTSATYIQLSSRTDLLISFIKSLTMTLYLVGPMFRVTMPMPADDLNRICKLLALMLAFFPALGTDESKEITKNSTMYSQSCYFNVVS